MHQSTGSQLFDHFTSQDTCTVKRERNMMENDEFESCYATSNKHKRLPNDFNTVIDYSFSSAPVDFTQNCETSVYENTTHSNLFHSEDSTDGCAKPSCIEGYNAVFDELIVSSCIPTTESVYDTCNEDTLIQGYSNPSTAETTTNNTTATLYDTFNRPKIESIMGKLS